MRALAFLLVAALLAAGTASAYPDPARAPAYHASPCKEPYDKRFVHDYVGVMVGEWGGLVERAACETYESTGAHFVLVAVADTEGESIEGYAARLFERWGVGDADRHDGLLLLYVRNYADLGAHVRVEVGYGLEPIVTGPAAAKVVRAMSEAKADAREAGHDEALATAVALGYGAGLLLELVVDGYEDGVPSREPAGPPLEFYVLVTVIVVFLLLILATSAKPRRGRGWAYYSGSPDWATGIAYVFTQSALGGLGGSFGGGRSGGGGFGGKL